MLRSALSFVDSPMGIVENRETLLRRCLRECAASDQDYAFRKNRDKKDYLACLDLLIAHGADLELPEFDGQNALHFAARHLDLYFIEALLDRGARIDAQTSGGMSAFHIAAAKARQPVAEMLARRGANISLPDFEGANPLHTAVISSKPEAISWLIQMGVSTNALDDEGRSPWQLCVDLIGPHDSWAPTLKAAFEAKEIGDHVNEAIPAPRKPRSL